MLKLFSRLLVPARCIYCNEEGMPVCRSCELDELKTRQQSCYLCNAMTGDGRVCGTCQWKTRVRRTNVVWRLDDQSEKLLYSLKYDGSEDTARFIAERMTRLELPFYDIITFVPDTSARRRERGYVAPQLIARELSRIARKPYVELLSRDIHTPQVGAGRDARWRQVKDNFTPRLPNYMEGRRVLLVDDAITTGATVTECARVLKLAGSGPVYVAAAVKK